MADIAGTQLDRSPRGPRSVVDQIAAQILNMILANELKPGQPIAIQELTSILEVSSIPVREALRRLEGRGLVQFRRSRRPQIAPINLSDFDDIYRLRTLLEGQIAERSAELMTPELIARLEATFTEFERIITTGNAFDVYSVHSQFHLLMLPNSTAWDHRLLDQLWVASERYIALYVGAHPNPASTKTILDAHRTLLNAARQADSQTLHDAIVEHVVHSHKLITPFVETATATGTAGTVDQTVFPVRHAGQ